jgi:spermidine/putrescine transport system substrate-binding protein
MTGKPGKAAARTLALALAVLAATIGLAACGSGIEGPVTVTVSKIELEKKASGNLVISNWPLYIDKKTVPNFEKVTGVSVEYKEDINSNEEFFNKVQPQLTNGESGGRSIMVLADYMVAKMIKLGYLEELNHEALPEVKVNLAKNLRHPPFDPERQYSVPWQSGMTGIIVNKEKAPEVHSICDLFDPKYKGKVDFLNEVRETVPLVMKCEGVELENDYAQDLTSGNAVAVIGWSGDAVQLQADNPNLEWRMPTEGCMLWSEDMIIPVGAPNPTAAEAFMNYVYKPEVQANIAAYVNYVTPVEGVQEVLQKTEPEVAENDLIFPSASFTKNCSPTPTLEGNEEKNVLKAFDEVLNG